MNINFFKRTASVKRSALFALDAKSAKKRKNFTNHLGLLYELPNSKQPFNKKTVSIITKRLERVKLGNLGDVRSIGKGVYELKIDYGAGYRIYFGQIANTIIIFLCASDKSTQDRDIIQAREYWENYRSE